MVRSSTRHQGVAASPHNRLRVVQSFVSSDIGISLIIALAWQAVMTVIGIYLALHSGSPSVNDAFISHMNHWDAGWYHHVLSYAYGTNGSPAAPAFYPLFPGLVALLSFLTFGLIDSTVIGLLVNTTALWLALIALLKILRQFTTSRHAIALGAALFLCFPAAFFMHVFYGEAVFIALGLWAYVCALGRRWWIAGALLGVLTAARLPSLLFVVLCALEYLRSYKWSIKAAFNGQALWLLSPPVGFVLYGIYLAVIRGDFFAMFHAYSATNDWVYQIFSPNIFAAIGDAVSKVIGALASHHLTYEVFINVFVPLVALTALIASSVYCLRSSKGHGVPLGAFGLLAAVMFTLNSNLISVHRYVLPCIVVYVAAASWYRKSWKSVILWGITLASLAVQLYLYTRFVSDVFAG